MPDVENSNTPIESLGKFGLIDRLASKAEKLNASTLKGPGDDSCIIDTADDLTLVSTDLLMEGIHFNLVYTPIKHLGYKAVIRGISDIYAMNGQPGQVLVSLGISSRFSVEQLDSLYEGISLACKKYNVDLAGGDITSSLTGLTIGITAVGTVSRRSVTARNGAKPNDLVCVTGDLGAAFMGLQVLEREGRLYNRDKSFQPDLSGYEYIIERQLKPEFPADVLKQLDKLGVLPTSMIDISDGLASDLMHICKSSGTGCRLYYDKIPIDTETFRTAGEFNIDPVIAAMNGGDDYELIFTTPPVNYAKINEIDGVRIIGHLTLPEKGYVLISPEGTEIELKAQGWQKL
jgi:thiamine-monophosphate kinase